MFQGYYQQKNVREEDYLKNFKSCYEVVKQFGGKKFNIPILINQNMIEKRLYPEMTSAAEINISSHQFKEKSWQ